MRKFSAFLVSTALASTVALNAPDAAADATDPIIGEIMLAGFNFCPRGWAAADGQLLAINTNQSLFSLYGTTYGGDGRVTFALPDLRGRAPIHVGQGPGLSNRSLGSIGGTQTETLTLSQLPSHTHRMGIQTSREAGNSTTPRQNAFGESPDNRYYNGLSPQGRFMNPATVTVDPAGNGLSNNNMMPYKTVNYCIALQGLYPSRD